MSILVPSIVIGGSGGIGGGGGGGGSRFCDAADFDGTNDYLYKNSAITGASNTTGCSFSCWVRLNSLASQQTLIQEVTTAGGTTARFHVYVTTSGYVVAKHWATTGTLLITLTGTSNPISTGVWTNILVGYFLSFSGAYGYIYANDAQQCSGTGLGAADWTEANWYIGAQGDGTQKVNGCMAEVIFKGTPLDFSNVTNRRKFIDASGYPVDLGSSGYLPYGPTPIYDPLSYHHLDYGESVSNFALDRAGNGDFTVAGSLATCASSPSPLS